MPFNLLTSKEKRQIKLIASILASENQTIEKKSLARALECSTRIIYPEVDEINNKFGDYIEIQRSNDRLKVIKYNDSTLSKIGQIIIQENLEFNIMAEAFLEKNNDVNVLSDMYFVSQSTIYRSIDKINNFFKHKKLGVSLVTNPLRFVGSEIILRQLWVHFIELFYDTSEWPLEDIDKSLFNNLISAMTNIFNYGKYFQTSSILKLEFSVNLNRLKKGYYYQEGDWHCSDELMDYILSFGDIRKALKVILEEQNLEFTSDNLKNLMMYIINDEMIINSKQFINELEDNIVHQESFNQFKQALQKLIKDFNLKSLDDQSFYHFALIIYNLSCAYSKTPNIFIEKAVYKEYEMINYLSSQFNTFDQRFRQIIKDYLKKLPTFNENYNFNEILFHLYSIWPSLLNQLEKPLTKPVIRIVTDSYFLSQQIANYFSTYIGKISNIIVSKESINNLPTIIDQTDILVTTCITPPSIDSKTLYLSKFPDFKTISQLLLMIKEIQNE